MVENRNDKGDMVEKKEIFSKSLSLTNVFVDMGIVCWTSLLEKIR